MHGPTGTEGERSAAAHPATDAGWERRDGDRPPRSLRTRPGPPRTAHPPPGAHRSAPRGPSEPPQLRPQPPQRRPSFTPAGSAAASARPTWRRRAGRRRGSVRRSGPFPAAAQQEARPLSAALFHFLPGELRGTAGAAPSCCRQRKFAPIFAIIPNPITAVRL